MHGAERAHGGDETIPPASPSKLAAIMASIALLRTPM